MPDEDKRAGRGSRTRSPVWKIATGVVGAAICVLLLILLLDAVSAVSEPHIDALSDHFNAQEEREVISSTELGVLQDAGEFRVDIIDDVLTLDFQIRVQSSSTVVKRLLRGSFEPDVTAFSGALVGNVVVDGEQLELTPRLSYVAGRPTSEVLVRAHHEPVMGSEIRIRLEPAYLVESNLRRTIHLRSGGYSIETRSGPLPTAQSDTSATWVLPAHGSLEIAALRGGTAATDSRAPVRQVLVRWAGAVENHAGSALTGFFGALPFLVFLIAVRRLKEQGDIDSGQQEVGRAEASTRLLLGFYIGLYVLLAVSSISYLISTSYPLTIGSDTYFLFFGQSWLPLFVAGISIAWPSWVRSHEVAAGRERGLTVWEVMGPVLLAGAIVVLLAKADRVPSEFGLPDLRTSLMLLGALTAACFIISFFLAKSFLRGGFVLAAWLAVGSVAFAVLQQASHGNEWFARSISVVVVTVAVLSLMYWLMRAAMLVFATRPLSSLSRWVVCLMLVVVVVVTFPYQGLTAEYGGWIPVYSAAFAVSGLVQAGLTLVLVLLAVKQPSLAVNGSEFVKMRADRDLALLIATVAFLSPTSRALLLPIKVMVGLPLFIWLVSFKTARLHGRVSALTGHGALLGGSLLALVRRERRLKDLQVEAIAHLGTDEESKYTSHARSLEAQVTSRKRAHGLKPAQNAAFLLSIGPDEDRLRRGLNTALLSLLIAVPWILLYVANYLGQSLQDHEFPLLGVLEVLVTTTVTWGMYGFFFGYYFAFIRGSSGLSKSINYALALVLPTLALTATDVLLEGSAWSAGIFFALQLFTQSMLLGLIGMDLRILKRAGLGWAELVEIHRLRGVAAWATSIVAAVGVAIATAVSSGVVEVLSNALKLVVDPGGDVPRR